MFWRRKLKVDDSNKMKYKTDLLFYFITNKTSVLQFAWVILFLMF